LILPDQIWTAASLWAGSRQWVRAFRAAGLQPGDRIVCALPPGAAFVQLLIASLWEELSLAIVPARDVDALRGPLLLSALDARLLICDDAAGAHVCAPGSAGWPETALPALRVSREAPTPDVRLLLRTTGTAGDAKWVALSDVNLLSVIDSHAPRLALAGACVLSVLPWHHAFGLVLGLLTSLLHADEIVRDPNGGRDVAALLDVAASHPVTHMDLVPLLASRLLEDARGAALMRALRGGIVGGAPVSESLCSALCATRLRVGYGQTEAAPGILLGEPSEWSDRFLGRAIGCEVRVDDDGVLVFRGENACVGAWTDGALRREPPDRWVRTGDMVEAISPDAYRLVGRASDSFKLSNGRMVDAARLEDHLRRALPDVVELLLRPHGDDSLELLITTAVLPDGAYLRGVLGALGPRLACVTPVSLDAWRRTPKGEVDRRTPLQPDLH
jgi:acyl-CoA synthetase (AMP-forming)/AMP-acid ligase II